MLCPNCESETVRVWTARPAAIHGDDKVIGGLEIEHLDHRPVTVYSRSELKREMDARGLQHMVRHAPEQGSDKSPHTTRWIGMPWSDAKGEAEFKEWLAKRQQGDKC